MKITLEEASHRSRKMQATDRCNSLQDLMQNKKELTRKSALFISS
jgi:hypothetical protein